MVKKKIDNRIRVMIENGVKMKHRTMFVVVGDKARDQVRKNFIQIAAWDLKIYQFYRFQFSMTCWLSLL